MTTANFSVLLQCWHFMYSNCSSWLYSIEKVNKGTSNFSADANLGNLQLKDSLYVWGIICKWCMFIYLSIHLVYCSWCYRQKQQAACDYKVWIGKRPNDGSIWTFNNDSNWTTLRSPSTLFKCIQLEANYFVHLLFHAMDRLCI